MKGDKLTFWLSFLAIIFAGITAFLSWIDPVNSEEEIPQVLKFLNLSTYNWLVSSKGSIAFWVFMGAVVIQCSIYLNAKDDKQLWLEEYMKLLAYKELGGTTSDQRITIFIKKRGWRFLFPYLLRSFKHKLWFGRITYFPNPFRLYLVPHVRFSHPDIKHSYTYFRITENKHEAESVVALCYAKAEAVNVDTTYIDEIQIPKAGRELLNTVKQEVEKYMKDTHMNSYKKVRLLCRKANHIYAIPIMQPEEKSNRLWGVLVFDKVSSDLSDSFTALLDDATIRDYLDVIKISLSKIS